MLPATAVICAEAQHYTITCNSQANLTVYNVPPSEEMWLGEKSMEFSSSCSRLRRLGVGEITVRNLLQRANLTGSQTEGMLWVIGHKLSLQSQSGGCWKKESRTFVIGSVSVFTLSFAASRQK